MAIQQGVNMVNKLILIGGAITAFFLLTGSNGSGGGGTSPDASKKATVISGIVVPEPTPQYTPAPSNQPAPYNPVPQNFIPTEYLMNNPDPSQLPFQPSQYILDQMEQSKKAQSYEAGTQQMFKNFGYSEMYKTSGTNEYDEQQIYSSIPTKKDMTTSEILAQRQDQVIVAPQSYVDMVSSPKDTSTGFSLAGIAAPQSYVDRVSSKKTIGGQTYSSDTKAGTGSQAGSVYRVIDGKKYYR